MWDVFRSHVAGGGGGGLDGIFSTLQAKVYFIKAACSPMNVILGGGVETWTVLLVLTREKGTGCVRASGRSFGATVTTTKYLQC